MRSGSRLFSAALTPVAVYVVSYRSTSRGLEVLEHAHRGGLGPDPAAAARALGGLIEAQGGRGGRVSVAVAGFGAYHHILTLPPAPRDVLLPVIGRELRRVFPGLFQADLEPPIIDYVEIGGSGTLPAGSQRELLSAAVPRSLIGTVRSELARREIALTHWTVLPRAMQRLHDAFIEGEAPTAAVLVTDGLPLLGFFHEGELRLFSDASAPGQGTADTSALVERIERGGLYLRQQFHGTALERVLLSTSEGPAADELARGVEARIGLEPEPFGPYSATPGVMLALGAALDQVAEDPFDLLPPELRPVRAQDRLSRILALASLALVLAAAGWWAWSGVRAESLARDRYEEVRRDLDRRAPEYMAMRDVLDARQSHEQRTEVLRLLLNSREQLPSILWPLENPGPGVRIDSLELQPYEDGGWSGTLGGTARAQTTAQATASVDGLFQSLRRNLAGARVAIEHMSPPERVADGELDIPEYAIPIAVTFRMSFIVPAVEEAVR